MLLLLQESLARTKRGLVGADIVSSHHGLEYAAQIKGELTGVVVAPVSHEALERALPEASVAPTKRLASEAPSLAATSSEHGIEAQFQTSITVRVVHLSLLNVGEDLVGLGHLFEIL